MPYMENFNWYSSNKKLSLKIAELGESQPRSPGVCNLKTVLAKRLKLIAVLIQFQIRDFFIFYF